MASKQARKIPTNFKRLIDYFCCNFNDCFNFLASILSFKKIFLKFMPLTLFEKIINKEIPAEILYEDDISIVIEDINPQAPIHLLVIPKKVIPKLSDANKEDQEILGHLMLVAGKIASRLKLDDAFRLVVNNGAKAGQSVFHLHLHLLSGRALNWPPG